MSSRHQGRHRAADAGPGRGPEPVERPAEGRHRRAAGRPAAVRPLLAASGTVAAALTAIVLTGAQGPLGALFPEREQEPRPTTASAGPRGGAPTATDVASVASYSSAPGSRLGLSVWDVLFQPDLGGQGAVQGMFRSGSTDAVWWPRGDGLGVGGLGVAGLGVGGTSSVALPGVPSTPAGMAPPPPATLSAFGNGSLVGTGSSPGERVAGPGREAPTPTPTSTSTDSDPVAESPANPVPDPVTPPVQALPPAMAAEPVIKAAEPVIKAAEPVTKAAEPVLAPVTKVLEPVVPAEPVEPPAPEPVKEALDSVVQAVPATEPEAEELPTGAGDALGLLTGELPG